MELSVKDQSKYDERLWVCPDNDLEARAIIEMLKREGEEVIVTGQD